MNYASQPTAKFTTKALLRSLFLGATAAVGLYAFFFLGSKYIIAIGKFATFNGESGPIGDTIGGTVGPLIAIVASVLTFLAFWVQYDANQQQKIDLQVERFENKFYQMLQIHRDNVGEIAIGRSTVGRKAFISFFSEIKFIYLFIKNYCEEHDDKHALSNEAIYNIAYLIFFFGCGPNSSKIILDIIGDNNKLFYTELAATIEIEKINYRSVSKNGGMLKVKEKDDIYFEINIRYLPFNGHMSKLSHYFRHLFQLVKFIDENYPYKQDYKAKSQYVTTLRSQLSTFEQLIIYYNALSVLGKPWLDIIPNEQEFLLKKYCLIKSMPVALADFYKEPKLIFGNETHNLNNIPLFEWHDIQMRFNMLQTKNI